MRLPFTRRASRQSISQVDVSALPVDAGQVPQLAVIGSEERASALLRLLEHGPGIEETPRIPAYQLPLAEDDARALAGYDLLLVVPEREEQLQDAGLKHLLTQPTPALLVQDALSPTAKAVDVVSGGQHPRTVRAVICSLNDAKAVKHTLLPAIVDMLARNQLAAGRAYPGLRPEVAHRIILRTSRVNASYAATTGTVELMPALTVPFAVADVVVLTTNQFFMARRLSILLGQSSALASLLPRLASVMGIGFILRQISRELVTLLPMGMAIKGGMVYVGTYTIGRAVYHHLVAGETPNGGYLPRPPKAARTRTRSAAIQAMKSVLAVRESVGARPPIKPPQAELVRAGQAQTGRKLSLV